MPRTARLVIPEVPYHITHRGNNRQQIFCYDNDYKTYLELLRDYAREERLTVLGYCLMPNHIHLIGIPSSQDSLAKALGQAQFRYAQLFNLRRNRGGHLWQDRFYSCALADSHLVLAMRYVERNPVRAGIVRLAWDYSWSSAAAHIGRGDFYGLLDLSAWRKYWSPEDWQEMLLQSEEEKQLTALRLCTRAGKPFGSKEFISKLAELRQRFEDSPRLREGVD